MDRTEVLKVTVVIPSLNPDDKLISTVQGIVDLGFTDVILINDGSDAEHLKPFEAAASLPQVTMLTHEVNKGKGRALKTAMEFFLQNRQDSPGIVTMDGDGQHHPEDVFACAEAMLEKNEVILGVRDFSLENVPWKSRVGNNFTKFIFRVFCGVKISDTQTGLRAFPAEVIGDFSQFYGERYEYETNMLLEMKHRKIGFEEVTIRTIYLDDNAATHFNPFKDSMRIYSVIFKFLGRTLGSFVKYAFSSGICAILDILLFALFNWLFISFVPSLEDHSVTMICTAGARVVSSFCNYLINRKAVFGSGDRASILKYYLLAALIMVSSGLLVSGLTQAVTVFSGVKIEEHVFVKALIKVVVDTALFFVSYSIQKKWVFGINKKGNE